MLEVSKLGHTVFRNNTGRLQNKFGAWVNYGLCKGSSDLIGWTKDGRFLAIEVKAPGKKPTDAQLNFIDKVNDAGGVAFCTDKVSDIYIFLKK